MPSYETPSKRELPGDEAHYQPGNSAKAEDLENSPEQTQEEEDR